MRHALLLFLVATAACKAPVPDKSAAAAPGMRYIIHPGDVTPFGPDAAFVSGAFALNVSSDPNSGAMKTGGACLAYQSPTQARCPTGDPTQCPERPGTFRYCIRDANLASCWYKPVRSGEDVACNKQPVIDLTLDVRHQTPLVAMFPARPATWRVITCQNVVPGGCASGKTGEQIVRYGPVARFP